MTDFGFLHTADIHLDSPLIGLGQRAPELAELFRQASRRALEAMVDAAIARNADFVVIAGDLYDRDWQDIATGHAFARAAGRLSRAGIGIFMVRGNHDAGSRIRRELPLPPGVHEFPSDAPATVDLPLLGVALHGWSFPETSVTENVVRGFPPALPGRFNIGILHTSLDGREGTAAYAPCAVEDLLALRYDYWALGHVHRRLVIREDPPIVYPGVLQGRHARETGPKGATFVRVSGGRAELEEIELDHARWETTEVDLSGADTRDAVDAAIRHALARTAGAASGRPVATRVVLEGATPCHAALVADASRLAEDVQALAHHSADALLVEKVVVSTRPPASASGSAEAEGLAEALSCLDATTLAELAAEVESEIAGRPLARRVLDPAEPSELVAAARDLVLARAATLAPEPNGAGSGDGADDAD